MGTSLFFDFAREGRSRREESDIATAKKHGAVAPCDASRSQLILPDGQFAHARHA
jgi:hypothetical protein